MWKFWDAFGMQDTDMIGWWEPESPVAIPQTTDVRATAYVIKGNKTLVAVASWAAASTSVTLAIDWTALGLAPGAVKTLVAPAIPNFQAAASFGVADHIVVPPAKGWLLVVEP